MGNTEIEVRPLTGTIGAEVFGIDLSNDLDEAARAALRRAFLDYNAIFLRDQKLTPDRLLAVAREFGEPGRYPLLNPIDGYPEIIEILKTETDRINFGANWHSDTTYMPKPFLGTVLYALETPPFGGDTNFANLYAAYEGLSDGMKDMLGGMRIVNSSAQKRLGGRAKKMQAMSAMKQSYGDDREVIEAVHPAVRTHPETGRKALFVSPSHVERFDGMTEEESRPLLDFLCAHVVKSEYLCLFRWAPGSLAIWDNRCTLHQAVNDYQGHRRRMHRVTLEGDAPR